jgi:hypothetical protein
MMAFTKKFVTRNFSEQPATQNLDSSSTSDDSVEEDLTAELQKWNSHVMTELPRETH